MRWPRRVWRGCVLMARWGSYLVGSGSVRLALGDFGTWARTTWFRRDLYDLDLPWLCLPAARFLDRHLRPGMRVLEWGSGASTLFLARRGCQVVSVEHDPAWVESSRARAAPYPEVEILGIADTDDAYVDAAGEVEPGSLDLVLVDGRRRCECLDRALVMVRPGGWVVLDDSERETYRSCLSTLPKPGWEVQHFYGPKPSSLWPAFTRATCLRREVLAGPGSGGDPDAGAGNDGHAAGQTRRLVRRVVRRLVRLVAPRAMRAAWTRRSIRRAQPRRVVLGASGIAPPGWISTEQDTLDLLESADWRIFDEHPADAFLAEHVWEHLTLAQGEVAARNCYSALRPGGYVRVAVPDGGMPDPEWRAAVEPGGWGAGADDHRVLYTLDSLAGVFARAGFDIEPLEYHDRNGQFHAREWDPGAGMVHRSLRFDPRNRAGRLGAPSIILDARKPVAP